MDSKAAGILVEWGDLGRSLQPSGRHYPAWSAAETLIDAARGKMLREAERLRGLLDSSQRCFKPLEDPLLCDYGSHRWLKESREEAYSDWLAWILGQQLRIQRICRLLGLGEPEVVRQCGDAKVRVEREYCIPEGHEGHTGRLDIVVRCPGVVLVVEVKVVEPESADLEKQEGYRKWLEVADGVFKEPVLLARGAMETLYKGQFRGLDWATLAIRLRTLAIELIRQDRVSFAAMVLAFVGAVEQNLLGFRSHLARRAHEGKDVRVRSDAGDHLERMLKEAGEQ